MKLKYTIFYLLIPIAGILLFVASSSNITSSGHKGNKGVIKFSHKVHKDAAECDVCHAAVKTSKSLGDRLMPTHDNCKDCHDVNDEKVCKTCHYDNVNEPLKQPKSELIFNHSAHINQQNLKCETCHKGVSDVEYAEDAPQASPAMETCYQCHNGTKAKIGNIVASNACEACHISTADLKPQSHKSTAFISSHKFAARGFKANCVMCHDNASCQECHSSTNMITEQNTAKDFYRPYSPSNSGSGAKQQQITRVHNLNYVYTHGIDAKGKTAECQSCHETETFCVSCHQGKEGDFSMGGVAPKTHLQPTFMVLGVGSGGGDHARLARRDIESCASCHDVQGGDPACIQCHTDPDGIKGTNPKTHPANFMRNDHGDWHTNNASVCFNCHTSASPASQPGVGFCGYCHGAK